MPFSLLRELGALFGPNLQVSEPAVAAFFPGESELVTELTRIGSLPSPLAIRIAEVAFLSF